MTGYEKFMKKETIEGETMGDVSVRSACKSLNNVDEYQMTTKSTKTLMKVLYGCVLRMLENTRYLDEAFIAYTKFGTKQLDAVEVFKSEFKVMDSPLYRDKLPKLPLTLKDLKLLRSVVDLSYVDLTDRFMKFSAIMPSVVLEFYRRRNAVTRGYGFSEVALHSDLKNIGVTGTVLKEGTFSDQHAFKLIHTNGINVLCYVGKLPPPRQIPETKTMISETKDDKPQRRQLTQGKRLPVSMAEFAKNTESAKKILETIEATKLMRALYCSVAMVLPNLQRMSDIGLAQRDFLKQLTALLQPGELELDNTPRPPTHELSLLHSLIQLPFTDGKERLQTIAAVIPAILEELHFRANPKHAAGQLRFQRIILTDKDYTGEDIGAREVRRHISLIGHRFKYFETMFEGILAYCPDYSNKHNLPTPAATQKAAKPFSKQEPSMNSPHYTPHYNGYPNNGQIGIDPYGNAHPFSPGFHPGIAQMQICASQFSRDALAVGANRRFETQHADDFLKLLIARDSKAVSALATYLTMSIHTAHRPIHMVSAGAGRQKSPVEIYEWLLISEQRGAEIIRDFHKFVNDMLPVVTLVEEIPITVVTNFKETQGNRKTQHPFLQYAHRYVISLGDTPAAHDANVLLNSYVYIAPERVFLAAYEEAPFGITASENFTGAVSRVVSEIVDLLEGHISADPLTGVFNRVTYAALHILNSLAIAGRNPLLTVPGLQKFKFVLQEQHEQLGSGHQFNTFVTTDPGHYVVEVAGQQCVVVSFNPLTPQTLTNGYAVMNQHGNQAPTGYGY